MRKTLVFLVLVSVVTVGGCGRERKKTRTPKSVLTCSPEKMWETLADTYRPAPDRRFLLAVGEIDSFLSGRKAVKANAEFSEGRWQISYRGKTVGRLPEFANFSDFMTMLVSWAKAVEAQHPVRWDSGLANSDYRDISNLLSEFFSSSVVSGLQKIDALWKRGGPRPALLAAATRGLTLLMVQRLDRLGVGDRLAGKAIAVLALDKALTKNPCPDEECLLSYATDYSNHAVQLAAALPPGDPVRLYVRHDDNRLMEAAIGANASVEARYFVLLRMVENGNEVDSIKNWIAVYFHQESFSLPVLKALMEIKGNFTVVPSLSEVLPRVLLLNILSQTAPASLEAKLKDGKYTKEEVISLTKAVDAVFELRTSTMFSRFDTGLQKVSSMCAGPFLDPATYRAFYNGYFFSSFYAGGLHYLDALSSIKASDEFSSELSGARSGIGADFKRWFLDLAAVKAGKASPAVLQADLVGLRRLGLRPLVRTFDAQEKFLPFGDPARLKSVKSLMPRIDTRPSGLEALFFMARSHLLDPNMSEKLAAKILAVDSENYVWLETWRAHERGDDKLLLGMLGSNRVCCPAKVTIIGYLQNSPGVSRDVLTKEYLQLVNDYPNSWQIARGCAKYLEKGGDYKGARSVLNGWLNRKVNTLGLERILAVVDLAHTYYREGRYEEGFNLIQPLISTQQAGAMLMGARLLDKLGRQAESEQLAQAIIDRYPDSPSFRAFLAGLYWRHGKFQQAAQTLKAAGKRLTNAVWQFTVAPVFFKAFPKGSGKEAESAFSVLEAQGFEPMYILSLTYPFAKNGRFQTAFAMSSGLRARNGMEDLEFLVQSYSFLEKARGEGAALHWLRRSVPPQYLGPLSMIAYSRKQYGLVWDVVANPGKGRNADFVWVMRAAASDLLGPDRDPHRAALIAHYKINSGAGYYDEVGRFLCGLLPQRALLKLATTPKKRCEIAYYTAVRARSRGRWADACDWYRVAMETGQTRMGEYRWATDTLYMWTNSGKSLERLRKESEAAPAGQ